MIPVSVGQGATEWRDYFSESGIVVERNHIVAEIQRTSRENGGVALGVARFEEETRNKVYDWFGVYWAKWSDAVREAGCEPNKFQDAHESEDLLRKLAALVQELGRIPVRGDLQMKRRSDRGFPSSKVYDRFGPKAEVVKRLLEFCRVREEFANVVSVCETYLESQEVDSESEPDSDEAAIGFVYLFKSGRFYKLGKSNSAGRREYELSIQLPERLQVIHVIRTDDPAGIEQYWHKRFAEKRQNGEWFDLNVADVRAFKRRKFM